MEIVSTNPATGEAIKSIRANEPGELVSIFAKAETAFGGWSQTPLKARSKFLLSLRESIIDHTDDLVDLISQETGKPKFEALSNDIVPAVELLTYFGNRAPKILADQKIGLSLLAIHRRSYLNYWPLGTVVVISPWNFPLFLPMGEIAMALVAGNAVIFKPSEVTPLVGLEIQKLCEKTGLPENVMQTVVGDGKLGAALVDAKPAKIFFTGSVRTGKKILEQAAKHYVPVNLELGGKDAMIVLPDADLDFASSAAVWGGFANSGQMCASTERLILHEDISNSFLEKLKEKISKLKQGAPSLSRKDSTDLGVIAFEKQKSIYEEHLKDAREKGVEFLSGGNFSKDKTYLEPTVVSGEKIKNTKVFNEETFGPVIAATTYKTIDEAIRITNDSPYGLLASIVTQNTSLAEEIAKKLQVGSVIINEVAYTVGLPSTPWGGVKDSGIGRKHSDQGLLDFVHVRHIHKPLARSFIFKSLWWYPYTPYQFQTFRKLLNLYRKSLWEKIKSIPDVLWHFVRFIKKEKRL